MEWMPKFEETAVETPQVFEIISGRWYLTTFMAKIHKENLQLVTALAGLPWTWSLEDFQKRIERNIPQEEVSRLCLSVDLTGMLFLHACR